MNMLTSLTGQNAVLLTSYRRDGTPVGTPVHLAVEGDHAFFRTYDKAWKYRRILRNSEVEIAPSTLRGHPTGPAMPATARLLDGADTSAAARALGGKYPVLHRSPGSSGCADTGPSTSGSIRPASPWRTNAAPLPPER